MTGADWTIRPAGAADADAVAGLHVEGWRAANGGIVETGYLDALDAADFAGCWRGWFADGQTRVQLALAGDGIPAGFVGYGRVRTPLPGQSPIRPLYSGEIYALYILPAYWRQGLGRLLMTAAAAGLAEMRHRSFCLWVLEGNRRAGDFYKALGGQRCGRKIIEIGARRLEELAFGWRDGAKLL